jgi:hypothetical protein
MGAIQSHDDLAFELSKNRKWIRVNPEDLCIRVSAIAMIVPVAEQGGTGLARLHLRLLDNSSADRRHSSSRDESRRLCAIDTIVSKPMPKQEAWDFMAKFTGFTFEEPSDEEEEEEDDDDIQVDE